MINKLKQQTPRAKISSGFFSKRKRHRTNTGNKYRNRPIKISKKSQNNLRNQILEESLHPELASLQNMFSSTKPVNTLNLKGNSQDNPDRFPVYLSSARFYSDTNRAFTPHVLSPAMSNNSSSYQSSDLNRSRYNSVDLVSPPYLKQSLVVSHLVKIKKNTPNE